MPVKKIKRDENMRITSKKFVSEVKNPVSKFDELVIGAIIKPDMMKMPKIINNIIVKLTRALSASLWVLNTTIVVNNINSTAITIEKFCMIGDGKKALITTKKAWAEKENVPILAIHKKNPIINAKKPPKASLLKL